jgi:hypothetical protein
MTGLRFRFRGTLRRLTMFTSGIPLFLSESAGSDFMGVGVTSMEPSGRDDRCVHRYAIACVLNDETVAGRR